MPKGHWLRAPERHWTQHDIDTLDQCVAAGYSDAYIGTILGRSANAVKIRRTRERIPSRTHRLLNSRKVAALLGVSCSKTVAKWIERGYLAGRKGQRRGVNRQWFIDEDDLLTFMQDARYWHLWEPRRITDFGLREWANELPRERLLTVGEVATRMFVTRGTVACWLDKGLLPFVRNGNRLVPESALAGFVMPSARPRGGMKPGPRFSREELARIVTLRREGWTFVRIGQELGRSCGSISNAFYRVTEVS